MKTYISLTLTAALAAGVELEASGTLLSPLQIFSNMFDTLDRNDDGLFDKDEVEHWVKKWDDQLVFAECKQECDPDEPTKWFGVFGTS